MSDMDHDNMPKLPPLHRRDGQGRPLMRVPCLHGIECHPPCDGYEWVVDQTLWEHEQQDRKVRALKDELIELHQLRRDSAKTLLAANQRISDLERVAGMALNFLDAIEDWPEGEGLSELTCELRNVLRAAPVTK